LLPIPFDWFTIHSRSSAGELVSRLSSCVEQDGLFLGKANYETLRSPSFLDGATYDSPEDIPETGWFRGRVWPTGFRLWRITGIRNSFLPVIRGRLIPTREGGTDIKIFMTLHPLVAALVAIMFSTGVATAVSAIDSTSRSVALVSCLFGVVLVLGGFWSEAPKARRILSRILDGDDPAKGSALASSLTRGCSGRLRRR
jgi:hypothetical protein